MTLADIPKTLTENDTWLLDYWAGELGVSRGRMVQAMRAVGTEIHRIRKFLKRGHTISFVYDGVERLVARVTGLNDGLSIFVPYHPATQGLLLKSPLDYSKKMNLVPMSEMETRTVSDKIKLSMHMTGFVQFSTLNKPIISGFNRELNQIKGVGLRAPANVQVATGPLCSVTVYDPSDFRENFGKLTEKFEQSDLWHNPLIPSHGSSTFHFEFFMFPNSLLPYTLPDDNNRRTFKSELPFNGRFAFQFHLRVIEIPYMPFFLGLIVTHHPDVESTPSGFTFGGPGCFDENGQAFGIIALYPPPCEFDLLEVESLDYRPTEET